MKILSLVLILLNFNTLQGQPLNLLEGKWKGNGTSYGQTISDNASFKWTLNKKFLAMKFEAADNSFMAEGYLRVDPVTGEYSMYEFNDGMWPVRILKEISSDKKMELKFEEITPDRHIIISLNFPDEKHFHLTETRIVEGKKDEVFVDELFEKE